MENIKRSGSGKCSHNTLYIYNLMSPIPPQHLPIFVSANLARLPPLDPDVYDISALSQQVNDKLITNRLSASPNQSSHITSKPTYKDALGSVSL